MIIDIAKKRWRFTTHSNSKIMNIGLLQGRKVMEIGSLSVRIVGFGGTRDGMPCSPTLECRGDSNWSVVLTDMGPNPASPHGDGNSVDFEVRLMSENGPLLCVGDPLVVALEPNNGAVLGIGHTVFTWRESVDVLEIISSPDGSLFAVLSTRWVTVFWSNGAIAHEQEIDGLARCGRWVNARRFSVEGLDPNSIDEAQVVWDIELPPDFPPSAEGRSCVRV